MGLSILLLRAGLLDGGVGEEEDEDGLDGEEEEEEPELEPTSSGVIKCTRPLMSVHLRSSQTTCESDEANFFSWFGRKFYLNENQNF